MTLVENADGTCPLVGRLTPEQADSARSAIERAERSCTGAGRRSGIAQRVLSRDLRGGYCRETRSRFRELGAVAMMSKLSGDISPSSKRLSATRACGLT